MGIEAIFFNIVLASLPGLDKVRKMRTIVPIMRTMEICFAGKNNYIAGSYRASQGIDPS